jgi:hypothetical protein
MTHASNKFNPLATIVILVVVLLTPPAGRVS